MRLSADYGSADYTAETSPVDQVETIANGDVVELGDGYGEARFTTASGVRLVAHGDVVYVEGDYDGPGDREVSYRYLGQSARVDLGDQDYTDDELWVPVGGEAGGLYRYLGTTAEFDLNAVDYSDDAVWAYVSGSPFSVYEWMGPDEVDADLNAQDYSDPTWWKPVGATDYFPQGLNITTSPSVSVAAVMVLNDVQSDVSATLIRATVDAANLTVLAIEQAAIRAEADVTATVCGRQQLHRRGLRARGRRHHRHEPRAGRGDRRSAPELPRHRR